MSQGRGTLASQGAHSATGTGEWRRRSARRADTGHWSATDLAALAGTGTLQCHRFSDTGMALSTGVPQTLATLGTDVPTESGSHADFLPNFALKAAQNPPRTLICSLLTLISLRRYIFNEFLASHPSNFDLRVQLR